MKQLLLFSSTDEFDVIHVYDGHDIVVQINNEQPDLVILDIMMPSGDGRDIIRDMRENPETKKIKVLMLSAKSEDFERIQGLELGADEYITKPFDPLIVGNKIKSMCGIKFTPSMQAR